MKQNNEWERRQKADVYVFYLVSCYWFDSSTSALWQIWQISPFFFLCVLVSFFPFNKFIYLPFIFIFILFKIEEMTSLGIKHRLVIVMALVQVIRLVQPRQLIMRKELLRLLWLNRQILFRYNVTSVSTPERWAYCSLKFGLQKRHMHNSSFNLVYLVFQQEQHHVYRHFNSIHHTSNCCIFLEKSTFIFFSCIVESCLFSF